MSVEGNGRPTVAENPFVAVGGLSVRIGEVSERP